MEIEKGSSGAPWRWHLIVSIVLLNICIPSLVLSYGVILVHGIQSLAISSTTPCVGYFTPSIYIFCYCIFQCWCRESADSWGAGGGYRILAASGVFLIAVGLLVCAFVPFAWQPFIYGGFGGLGSSLLFSQIDAIIYETYDLRIDVIKGMCHFGQAVGLFIFPHIINVIVEHYGYYPSFLLLSAIILQLLPVTMCIKSDLHRRLLSYSRYSDIAQAYAIFDNNAYEVKLKDFHTNKYWNIASDSQSDKDNDIENNKVDTEKITYTQNVEKTFRNIHGVEILPEIREENEDSENDNEQNLKANKGKISVAIKRLSSLSTSFDEYITRSNKIHSVDDTMHEYSQLDASCDSFTLVTDEGTDKVLSSFGYQFNSMLANVRRKLWIPSYRIYRIRKRVRHIFFIANDTFMKPLIRSLSCWRFYPVLLLAFCRLSSIAVTLMILPLIDLDLDSSIMETNFIMSLYGFAWMCFLLITPWLVQTPKRNHKYVVVIGLAIYASAAYMLSIAKNHDAFAVGSVVAGLGFGAITSCWEKAAQDFLGVQKWAKVQSTLETLSGTMIVALVFGQSYVMKKDFEIRVMMIIMCGVYSFVGLIWFIIAFYFDQIRTY